jgi:hypothetical protein
MEESMRKKNSKGRERVRKKERNKRRFDHSKFELFWKRGK